MTQQATIKAYHHFVKGIITEAGPLTFPEDAALDMENVVLNREGSIQRRLGMDFEDDFVLIDTPLQDDDAVACFRWKNANNDTTKQFGVVQAGHLLHFFDASQPSASANRFSFADLSAYIDPNKPIQVASGLGRLFVVGGNSAPVYLTYDPVGGGVSVTQYPLLIRDIFGVEDGQAINGRPAVLSAEHEYNLLNQGWGDAQITAFHTAHGVYPSNCDVWWLGKDANDDFDASLLLKQDFGTTPAPKGRFIIDTSDYSNSRTAESGVVLPAAADLGRPSAIAFGFERLFYAGVRSQLTGATGKQPNTSGFVYYSRTLRNVEDAGQCHADADPTSEVDSELVDTDGGFVNIPNCGHIHKMVVKNDYVLVFAEEGIWGIRGDEGGFRATANQVVKISNFGVLSASSVVDAEDRIYYWNRGGIYLLAPNDVGIFAATNITEETIQTLFNSLTQAAKETAVGSYDPVNRRVTWLYNNEPDYTTDAFRNRYNKELVLDTVLGAFYKHGISAYDNPSPYVAGYMETPDFVKNLEGVRPRGDSVTKYLTIQFIDPVTDAASISFAYYKNPSLRDWKSLDGVGSSFSSYILTGYEILGDSARSKQSPYLFTHFQYTETDAIDDGLGNIVVENPSSCIVQAQWDWADHPDSGKWGNEFEAYRLLKPYILPETPGPISYGHKVITNKHRLPGSGKAISLYFRSNEDNDFYLYGWLARYTGASYV